MSVTALVLVVVVLCSAQHWAHGQGLAVTIAVNYTPPADFDRTSESDYRAASPVILTCQVEGATGTVSYQWTSTCSDSACFVQGTGQSVSQAFLRAGVDGGTHTCTATDSVGGETGSDSIVMNIVGAGVYVIAGDSTNVPTGALTNNGIVVALSTGTIISGRRVTIRFQCRSGSTNSDPSPQFFGLDGNPLSSGTVGYLSISFTIHPSTLRVDSRGNDGPTAEEEGVYTCRMRDENEETVEVNVGIYRNGFNTPPNITSLTFDPDSFTLTCTSTGSPATNVTWMKDGSPLVIDGTTYSMEQTVTGRSTSTYDNVLTISNTPDTAAGNYTCTVENALGTASEEEEVVVLVLEISTPKLPLTVGEQATLNCTSDLPAIMTQWEYNGATVAVDDTGEIAQLTFNPVNDSIHEGVFTCRVTTTAGREFAENLTVTVEVPMPALNLMTEVSGEPTAGQTYSITCTVSEVIDGLTNSPAVEWLDSLVAAGDLSVDDPEMSASQRITFGPLLTSHGGEYTCRATLDSPAVEGDNITAVDIQNVTVEIPAPGVSVGIPQGPLYTGTNLTLTCDITLSESVDIAVNVSVTWTGPKGTLLCDDSLITVTNTVGSRTSYQSTLTFTPLKTGHGGNYTCEATISPADVTPFITISQAGSDTRLVVVRASPPSLMFDPVTFTLNCTSTGIPPAVTWMKNGSSLSGDYNITSQVPKVGSTTIYDSVLALPHSGDAAGNYTCGIEDALFKFPRLSITLQEEAVIQLQIGPLTHCTTWSASKAQEIKTAIHKEIVGIIAGSTPYKLSESLLRGGVFRCWTTQTEATFRGTIASSPYTDELVRYISEWVKAEPIVQVGDFQLGVNKDCPVRISSMSDPECSGTEPSADGPSVIASSDPIIIQCLNFCLARVRGEPLCASP